MKRISIVIPAYNEAAYIGQLLERIERIDILQEGFDKQIIVVDDGSTDETAKIASSFSGVTVLSKPNGGKGSAVQMGIQAANGDYILIQDADLEYNPEDYLPMLQALKLCKCPSAVYGSRPLGQLQNQNKFNLLAGKHPRQDIGPWLCNLVLGIECLILFGKFITDNLTAYKLYPAEVIKNHTFTTTGFEGDHEITSLLLRKSYNIVEVPISYEPRSVEEGKKIRATDGLIAMWTFLRCRFARGKQWRI